MGRLSRAIVDTSVLIGATDPVPERRSDDAAISVVTLGELRAGVLTARDPRTRMVRQGRLSAVRAAFEALPVDESVADAYGEILALARHERRTVKATDLLIIATAATTGRGLVSLDRSQVGLAEAYGVLTSPAT